MKRILPILCAPLLFGQVNGQSFNKSYDLSADDYGNNIMRHEEGLMIVGSSTSNSGGTFCAAVMNADFDGVMLESGGQLGGPGTEFGRDFYTSENHDLTILGRSNSFTEVSQDQNDFMVVRIGDGGVPQWMTVFGSDSTDVAIDMAEANDGGVIVVGQSKRRHQQRIDAVAVKLSADDGSIEWAKEIGFEFINETAFHVRALGPGEGYVILGYSGANVIGLNEAMVVLLDDDGNKTFAFLFGAAWDDDARMLLDGPSGDDGFYIAGNTRNIGQGAGEAFLARFTTENDIPELVWFKTYGASGNESLQSAFKDEDDNYLLVGTTNSFGNGQEGFVVKVDSDGEVIWANVYGGSGDDFLQNVISDGDGGYLAVGYSNSFVGTANDVWVVRMDADGNSGCQQEAAAFVKTDIDPSVAYMVTSHEALDNITSTDVSLAVRNSSGLGFFEHTPAESDLCNPVSVEENLSDSRTFNVFPNPSSNGIFTVMTWEGQKQVMVLDAMGRVVNTSSSVQSTSFTLDLSASPSGIYLLTLTDVDSGTRENVRIVR